MTDPHLEPDAEAALEAAAAVEHPPALLDREPVLVIVLGGALIPALLSLLVAFGIELTETQTASILGLVSAGVAIVSALAARRRAFAPATVAKLLAP